ncbi:Sau3AI family type II restriction endonuclease [Bavariicoccus seileri]|uniref:Sau3AI family type II restriction endonuclease n=1 Tax=Bavariicoccus seileri TaxID=549685 RepID=UPI0003B6283D|nr:Sau3AI family type II restriction endonuclease [Bavariicoccus seileri]
MIEKKWKNVDEVHEHAKKAVNKRIRDLICEETLSKYYLHPNNKGWIGNAIESDWFGIPNNNRGEADIPYLGLEIKVTPIKKTKNGWSAKERLVLNIFDFNDEYKRSFEHASFVEKAELTELMYYEYLVNEESPDLYIKAATLFDLKKLPEEDMLIIKQDWEKIVEYILQGKAEELSDSLTKYLGATTKGAKSERNMTKQPFSEVMAHRRAFTLKGSYMSQVAKKIMTENHETERVIKNNHELKVNTFEEIIIKKFKPYVGKTKKELAQLFDIDIPEKNDKASSALLAKRMLNLDSSIDDTEEFKKADISVKILTVESKKRRTTEGFKILIPGQSTINPAKLVKEDWEDSSLREYLTSYQFLLVVYEKRESETYFQGVKFWRVPFRDLEGDIKKSWEEIKSIFKKGVTLKYKKLEMPTKTGRLYNVTNNLPGIRRGKILHIRPSAKRASYSKNKSLSVQLPSKSIWVDKPKKTDWVEGTEPQMSVAEELSDYYMTKQTWWFNADYMYEQVSDVVENYHYYVDSE